MEIDLIELKKLIDLGHREYVVLLDYLRFVKDIDNIEKIHYDIEKMYPNDKDLYVELANYYVSNNDTGKAIKCLEKYRENKGENINVLVLLSKKYIDVKNFEKAQELLEELNVKHNKNEEVNNLLVSVIHKKRKKHGD